MLLKAHYTDTLHDTELLIENTEGVYGDDPLRFTLDGIRFSGSSFGDFSLADPAQAPIARQRFCLLQWGGSNTIGGRVLRQPYRYELQRYRLALELPVSLCGPGGEPAEGALRLVFRYLAHDPARPQCILLCDGERVWRDDAVVEEFSLLAGGERHYSRRRTLCFEEALADLAAQLAGRYTLRCCFTCQWSDYSPCGSDDFGTLFCFCRHKADYLKVETKDDLFALMARAGYDARQETWLCGEYAPRTRVGGYRGFVPGLR